MKKNLFLLLTFITYQEILSDIIPKDISTLQYFSINFYSFYNIKENIDVFYNQSSGNKIIFPYNYIYFFKKVFLNVTTEETDGYLTFNISSLSYLNTLGLVFYSETNEGPDDKIYFLDNKILFTIMSKYSDFYVVKLNILFINVTLMIYRIDLDINATKHFFDSNYILPFNKNKAKIKSIKDEIPSNFYYKPLTASIQVACFIIFVLYIIYMIKTREKNVSLEENKKEEEINNNSSSS